MRLRFPLGDSELRLEVPLAVWRCVPLSRAVGTSLTDPRYLEPTGHQRGVRRAMFAGQSSISVEPRIWRECMWRKLIRFQRLRTHTFRIRLCSSHDKYSCTVYLQTHSLRLRAEETQRSAREPF